jgi:hypothetical protein
MAASRTPSDRKRKSSTPTTASEWRKNVTYPVPVPSGNTALLRAVGMQAFINKGMIPNSLMPQVEKALKGSKEAVNAADLFKDVDITAETLAEMMEMIDQVVVFTVVQPKVYAAPKDESGNVIDFDDRDPIDGLWVDEVDFEDKEFIFQFAVGGTRDLETFRRQHATQLASLRDGENVEVPSQ